MKIYTRKKKPALYGFLVFSVLCFASAGALYHFGIFGSWENGRFAVYMTAYYLTAVIAPAVTLVRQMQYNPYSYNTIYYFGYALFALTLCVTHGFNAYACLAHSDSFTPTDAATLLVNSARQYIILSLPFIALFSIALTVSNVILIRREGFRPQNLLGIILAGFLSLGEAAAFVFDVKPTAFGFAAGLFSFGYLYVECMIIGALFANFFAALHTPAFDKDRILILGCRVRSDGSPTPLLRRRADAALDFAKKQLDATGKRASFIPSGGKGPDEPISEAECVRDYLVSRGVQEADIVLEDRSTDTLENMRFSFAKTAPEEKCAFATSDYHVFRSGIWAGRACKFKAEGIGAKTKWYFRPNAAVRELAGLLSEHRGKQALVLLGLIALYVTAFLGAFGK